MLVQLERVKYPEKCQSSPAFSKETQHELIKNIAKRIHEEKLSRDFTFIDDVENYQKFYKSRVYEECRDPNLAPNMICYGIFDTREMDEPSISKEGNLIYYAYCKIHKIPYKISFDKNMQHPTCSLLPSV